jgi:hypothetical protein
VDVDSVIAAVAALATLLAVVTALFKELLIARLWPPKVH